MTRLLYGIEDYLEDASQAERLPAGCAASSFRSAVRSARRATSSSGVAPDFSPRTGRRLPAGTVCRCFGR